MYQMDQLLNLLTAEKARELQFRAGSPPIIISEQERYLLQGPPIDGQELVNLLRCLANSRQMRDLRESGAVQFVYTAPGRSPFVVRANLEGGGVVFVVS